MLTCAAQLYLGEHGGGTHITNVHYAQQLTAVMPPQPVLCYNQLRMADGPDGRTGLHHLHDDHQDIRLHLLRAYRRQSCPRHLRIRYHGHQHYIVSCFFLLLSPQVRDRYVRIHD